MRTTLRIDDDLMQQLRERAYARGVSLSRLLNQLLRQGLASKPAKKAAYREKIFCMGTPRINLDKALAFAATDEDEQVMQKLALRK